MSNFFMASTIYEPNLLRTQSFYCCVRRVFTAALRAFHDWLGKMMDEQFTLQETVDGLSVDIQCRREANIIFKPSLMRNQKRERKGSGRRIQIAATEIPIPTLGRDWLPVG